MSEVTVVAEPRKGITIPVWTQQPWLRYALFALLGVALWFGVERAYSWYAAPTPPPKEIISIPATLSTRVGVPVEIVADSLGGVVKWHVVETTWFVTGASKHFSREADEGKTLLFSSPTAGTFKVFAWTAYKRKPSDLAVCVVTVTGDTPPVPPVPPTPPLPPTPPVPPPNPAPIPAAGLRVLIVEETEDRVRLPSSQLAILTSVPLRTYLNSVCVKGPDGKTPEYRFLDTNTNMAGESQLWQEAMKRQRGGLPSILISNGKTGFEGALPKTVEEVLALVKKYAE